MMRHGASGPHLAGGARSTSHTWMRMSTLALIVVLSMLSLTGGAGAAVEDDLQIAVPAADRVDAGLFAPHIYLKALHTLNQDDSTGTRLSIPGQPGDPLGDALQLFREAEQVARGEGVAIVRNARLRYAAVETIAQRAHADRDGGDAYRAAVALSARAESLTADPAAARAQWDEAIDSLVAAMGAAERTRVAAPGGKPALPFTVYDSCPYEGCCYRIWFAERDLAARVNPDSASAVAFEILPGEGVLGITGILITSRFGRCTLDPNPDEARKGMKPEPITVVGYEGEGFVRAIYHGRLVIVECDWDREIVEPAYVWWALVQNRDGKTGWVVGGPREGQYFYNQDAIEFNSYNREMWCR